MVTDEQVGVDITVSNDRSKVHCSGVITYLNILRPSVHKAEHTQRWRGPREFIHNKNIYSEL